MVPAVSLTEICIPGFFFKGPPQAATVGQLLSSVSFSPDSLPRFAILMNGLSLYAALILSIK